MKIKRTVQVEVEVSVITDINQSPLTSAPHATGTYQFKDGRNTVRFKTAKINPNNRRVYIVSLFEEDLVDLVDIYFPDEPETKGQIENNQFYVYNYQLV